MSIRRIRAWVRAEGDITRDVLQLGLVHVYADNLSLRYQNTVKRGMKPAASTTSKAFSTTS